jgi:hypothetical protein
VSANDTKCKITNRSIVHPLVFNPPSKPLERRTPRFKVLVGGTSDGVGDDLAVLDECTEFHVVSGAGEIYQGPAFLLSLSAGRRAA